MDSLLTLDDLEWGKLGAVGALAEAVIPVAVQDLESGVVLMVAYVSRVAVEESMSTGQAVFYSTSTAALHRKGETSGNTLELEEVRVNCDSNSLLFLVRLNGEGACHAKTPAGTPFHSCFHRTMSSTP